MIYETTKEKVKDYIIAILLVVIAVLIGIVFSKELMLKNISDRNITINTTKKQITGYFDNLSTDGYVLNDFSTAANFDYNLGTVNLFNKDYQLFITNVHYECNPDCVYMYKVGTSDKQLYQSIYLSGIKVGVIGNYIAIQEIGTTGQMRLLLYRANDGLLVQEYTFTGSLDITHNEGIYTLSFKENNVPNKTTITYNKVENTFTRSE